MPLVTLLCGPAGAGKTTHARGLERLGALRLSMDEAVWHDGWRDHEPPIERLHELHRGLQQQLIAAVRSGRDVVVDLSLASLAVRDEWRTVAAAAGADVHLVVLTAPLEVLQRRVAARSGKGHANAVRLSPQQLRDYLAGFDWPDDDERPTVIDTG